MATKCQKRLGTTRTRKDYKRAHKSTSEIVYSLLVIVLPAVNMQSRWLC